MVVLFAVHPLLGLVTLAGAGVVIVVAFANRYLTQGAIDRGMMEETASRDFADHGQRNAETIAAMGMSDAVIGHWRALQNTSLATAQRASDVTEATSSFSKAFRMFLQSAMLTTGAWLVLGHEMSSGMIIASSVISGRLLAPIDQMIAQWKQIGRASVAHGRLRDFFDAQKTLPEPLGLARPTGQISASNLVRFMPQTEPGRERRRQIDRVSFTLEPGAGLGVIGDSASGKSTLARLLVGACASDAGELRFDGATREQWGPDLGRHIGYLPQAVVMLPGSVRDNIRRFMTERSAKEVIEAAQMAGVHDMILRLPQGYDTMLGVPGQPLSGGQLQRIGLARAIFGQPPIVVLDEPNSSLDSAGEVALRDTISALRAKGSTVILITHRIGTLQAMDHVLLLKQGSVAKYGPRDEVLTSLGMVASGAQTGGQTGGQTGARPVTFLRPKMQGSSISAVARIEAEPMVAAETAAPAAAQARATALPALQLTPALAVDGKPGAAVARSGIVMAPPARSDEGEPAGVFYRKNRPGSMEAVLAQMPEADRLAANLGPAAARKEK
jgi:ATP-binding cassette, subfamily C, bacterial exporter for protease/lipase